MAEPVRIVLPPWKGTNTQEMVLGSVSIFPSLGATTQVVQVHRWCLRVSATPGADPWVPLLSRLWPCPGCSKSHSLIPPLMA